jgi:hypothetical protein
MYDESRCGNPLAKVFLSYKMKIMLPLGCHMKCGTMTCRYALLGKIGHPSEQINTHFLIFS